MTSIIFYDTETTDKLINFAQIIQCGSILTNELFTPLDQQDVSCGPLPWIIPKAGAMLTNKKTNLLKSNTSHFKMMCDIHYKWREWTLEQPGIFVTYNGHAFDEELIRRQFYWNLLDIYLTNTNDNGRLDLFIMFQNLVAFFPDALNIPLFEGGPSISMKLEDIAKVNGVQTENAHDAIADCHFMISLIEKINSKYPEWVTYILKTATKIGLKQAINCKTFLCLGEYFKREIFRYPVVCCGADASRPNEIVFFDLSYDPDEIFDLEYSEILKMLKTNGKNEPLKKYKINKSIPICPFEMIEDKNIFDVDPELLLQRAKLVKENQEFFEKVSQAMQDRIFNFPEPEYVEQKIYSGFPDNDDAELIKDFHRIDDIDYKIKIAMNLNDERFKMLAERLICQLYPDRAPMDMMQRYNDFLDERLNTAGPWGSTEKALEEIEKFNKTEDAQEKTILEATKKFIIERSA